MLKTKFEDIVKVDDIATGRFADPSSIIPLALQEKVLPANKDGQRILLIGIDYQNAFVVPDASQVAPGEPFGTLSVPGAKQDLYNYLRFFYNNFEKITRVMLSVDTHYVWQIFHNSMWRDEAGQAVPPLTPITTADIQSGKYRFVGGDPNEAYKCVSYLEKANKGGVFLWPYHCLIGTSGWNLDPQLMQMVHFHSAARNVEPIIGFKGTDKFSEMYGVLEPEYNPRNIVTKALLDAIASFDNSTGELNKFIWDKIIIGGEAGSHCLAESVRQILKRFVNYPDIIQRIYILKDCTSAVGGFEKQMNDAFDEFQRMGVNIVNSTDLIL